MRPLLPRGLYFLNLWASQGDAGMASDTYRSNTSRVNARLVDCGAGTGATHATQHQFAPAQARRNKANSQLAATRQLR